jgi:hypothetical protein
MEKPRLEALPPPPGVIGSLKAGFDTVSVHLTAILLPLALDLLLWLGPRLSVKQYYQSMLPELANSWRALGFSAAQVQSAMDGYRAQVTQLDSLNLLSLLRTFPIGITSLLSGPAPDLTPLGQPHVLQVGPLGNIFFLFVGVILLGWMGGALYFRWVASLVSREGAVASAKALLQSLTLSALAFAGMLIIGLPVVLVVFLLNAISPTIAQIVLLVLGFLSIWLIVPLFFAGHGIFLRRQNVLASILSGVQLARFSLPTSSLFVLSVLFIGIGLNFVWLIPRPDSWMLLIGILGHAFVSTALLASSFIYYRDMTAWLQTIFERLQAGAVKT